jgi:hypothetical protein
LTADAENKRENKTEYNKDAMPRMISYNQHSSSNLDGPTKSGGKKTMNFKDK